MPCQTSKHSKPLIFTLAKMEPRRRTCNVAPMDILFPGGPVCSALVHNEFLWAPSDCSGHANTDMAITMPYKAAALLISARWNVTTRTYAPAIAVSVHRAQVSSQVNGSSQQKWLCRNPSSRESQHGMHMQHSLTHPGGIQPNRCA